MWLGLTQPGVSAQAEPNRVFLIATPTLPVAQSAEALAPPPPPTAIPEPTVVPARELAAPTPQVIYQQVVVEVPSNAPLPEVVYVEVPSNAPPIPAEVDSEIVPEAAPAPAPQTLLEIEQAAAEAHRDLPTLHCPCGNDAPNQSPMPRGAGTR